jgi:hypothetical protein
MPFVTYYGILLLWNINAAGMAKRTGQVTINTQKRGFVDSRVYISSFYSIHSKSIRIVVLT